MPAYVSFLSDDACMSFGDIVYPHIPGMVPREFTISVCHWLSFCCDHCNGGMWVLLCTFWV